MKKRELGGGGGGILTHNFQLCTLSDECTRRERFLCCAYREGRTLGTSLVLGKNSKQNSFKHGYNASDAGILPPFSSRI